MAELSKRTKLQIWRDVIIALFIREIRTGFNDKFGVSWSVISPVAFIFILSFVRGRMMGADVYTMPIFTFMAVGLLLFQFFQQGMNDVARAYKSSKALYAFRQVQPLSAVLASALFGFITKFVSIAIIVGIMYFLRMEIRADDLLGALVVLFSLTFTGMGIGLVVAIGEAFIPEVSKLFSLATRPLLFISCVFFSINEIPQEYWVYFEWNPLANAIELSRGALYSSYPTGPMTYQYLLSFAICSFGFGLMFYQALWKRALSR